MGQSVHMYKQLGCVSNDSEPNIQLPGVQWHEFVCVTVTIDQTGIITGDILVMICN